MGKQRMDEVCGIERRAPPWAPRCPQTDQQEAVSVCACVSLFVRKTKGGRKRAVACTDAHPCVCLQSAHMDLCIFMSVYICGWVYRCMCMCQAWCMGAERDVCRQWARTEKCIGMSQKTADNSKTKLYPCPSGSSTLKLRKFFQRGALINSCPSGWNKKTRFPQISSPNIFPYTDTLSNSVLHTHVLHIHRSRGCYRRHTGR